jgi:lipopolysaccharide biosynthesis glycosyltransferase
MYKKQFSIFRLINFLKIVTKNMKLVIFVVFLCIILNSIESKDVNDKNRINVGITFTKVNEHESLIEKFKTCVSSLLKYAKVDINFFIIGDAHSQQVARDILSKVKNYDIDFKIIDVDADKLAKKMHQLVSKMQIHFSHSPSSYYGDSLFFLSIGLFKVFNPNIGKIILLDSDLKFKTDIGQLYDLFNKFNDSNLIGIARDGQPVYRHLFWKYRKENPETRVGNPPPNGLPGFNSGVLLLDLEKMRKSKIYSDLINPETVEKLTEKYYFKGHLGDQDFFTLLSMENEDLFYVLPCTWNRQLCTWWGKHGYEDVFDQYYKCDGEINVYHGNCNTEIPRDEDDIEFESYFKQENIIKEDL